MPVLLNQRARSAVVTGLGRALTKVEIYGGVMPTDADAAAPGALLLLAAFNIGLVGTPESTAIWLPEPVSDLCYGTGTATWGRLFGKETSYYTTDYSDLVITAPAGVSGTAGAFFILDTTTLVAGSEVWLTSIRLGQPAS